MDCRQNLSRKRVRGEGPDGSSSWHWTTDLRYSCGSNHHGRYCLNDKRARMGEATQLVAEDGRYPCGFDWDAADCWD